MNLGRKLFLSYLIVIAVSLVVLAISTAFVAPVSFSHHIEMMMGRPMSGRMMGGMVSLLDDIQESFRQALTNALILAGGAAIIAAILTSWFISRRITRPVHEMVKASQRIASGRYDERLIFYGGKDELGDLTRHFNQMAASLAESEKMRQQLIADVSHELKTPLASIKGYMEGLQDGVIEPSFETFELVHHEANRLQRLAHDLQELSQAEASQLQIDAVPCDAGSIVKSAVDWLRPQFATKEVRLTLNLPDHPIQALADFDRVRQVMLNILGNALQYTPPGGEVTVGLSNQDRVAQFIVRDTGIGLAPDDLAHIFDRFYRVDKSRSRAGGGSGIGLTISRHIVVLHGGTIAAASDGLGQGSTFSFTLPLV